MDPNRLKALPIFSQLSDAEAKRLAAFATETSVMGLLQREPRNASVIATSPMRLMTLTHWEIRRMSADTLDRIKAIVEERRQDGLADPAH